MPQAGLVVCPPLASHLVGGRQREEIRFCTVDSWDPCLQHVIFHEAEPKSKLGRGGLGERETRKACHLPLARQIIPGLPLRWGQSRRFGPESRALAARPFMRFRLSPWPCPSPNDRWDCLPPASHGDATLNLACPSYPMQTGTAASPPSAQKPGRTARSRPEKERAVCACIRPSSVGSKSRFAESTGGGRRMAQEQVKPFRC